jgi:hypothetical protein
MTYNNQYHLPIIPLSYHVGSVPARGGLGHSTSQARWHSIANPRGRAEDAGTHFLLDQVATDWHRGVCECVFLYMCVYVCQLTPHLLLHTLCTHCITHTPRTTLYILHVLTPPSTSPLASFQRPCSLRPRHSICSCSLDASRLTWVET